MIELPTFLELASGPPPMVPCSPFEFEAFREGNVKELHTFFLLKRQRCQFERTNLYLFLSKLSLFFLSFLS